LTAVRGAPCALTAAFLAFFAAGFSAADETRFF
jgi:hypothetical protein